MEKEPSEIVLFGNWASDFTRRIKLALKLKGIPYECVEEDLTKKSDFLLHYNPVHKKVPVLVHKGKPIAESLIILEYIDECWNNAPKILPEDPYQRAKVRFWANFYDQKLLASTYPIIYSQGKEREKALEEYSELLRVFVEGIETDFGTQPSFFDGENLGLLDIIVAANSCSYQAFEEALDLGYEPKKRQGFLSWVTALQSCPSVKETLPSHDKLVALVREKFLHAPKG